MDLYMSPLTCSLAVHVACLEAGVPLKLHRVDRRTKLLDDGRDYRAIAPQAIVPTIRLPDGSLLGEVAAVLQYVADLAPATSLAPRWGTPERYRLIEWLSFVGTELHRKHLWPIFNFTTPEPVKAFAVSTASPPLAHLAAHLEKNDHLLGDHFTVADAYLFWALLVAPHGGLKLEPYPSLVKYVDRVQARKSVQTALAIERPLYLQSKNAHAQSPEAQPAT